MAAQGDRARRTQAPAVARRDEQRAIPWGGAATLDGDHQAHAHVRFRRAIRPLEMAGAVPGERTSRLQHSAEVTVSLATSELRADLVEGDATSTTRRGGRRPWNTRRHDLRLVCRAVRAAAAGSSSGVWTRCAAGGSAMHAYIAFSSSRRAATARVCAQSVPVTRTESHHNGPDLESYPRIAERELQAGGTSPRCPGRLRSGQRSSSQPARECPRRESGPRQMTSA